MFKKVRFQAHGTESSKKVQPLCKLMSHIISEMSVHLYITILPSTVLQIEIKKTHDFLKN